MATKLQYATNPIASNSAQSFSAYHLDDWEFYYSNKGIKEGLKGLSITKRMFEPQDMDSIKKTMLVHEEIFKYQVRELHRLYSVQRQLMDELKKEIMQDKFGGRIPGMEIKNTSHHSPHHSAIIQTTLGYDFGHPCRDETSTHEQNASCFAEAFQALKGMEFEETSTGVSTIEEDQKTSGMKLNEDCDVELTLSLACNTSQKTLRNLRQTEGQECKGINDNMSSSASNTTLDRQSKQLHWLFQDLSPNST